MAAESILNSTEEPEEGEIIEDELEDVSDCSINSPLSLGGKSQQSTERLRSVSLSSISDIDVEIVPPTPQSKIAEKLCAQRKSKSSSSRIIKSRRRSRRQRSSCSCCKRHNGKRVAPPSSDSEEEKKLDRRTLRQLKEAIRVSNGAKEVQKNSLRARLRGLIEGEGEAQVPEKTEIETQNEEKEEGNVEDSLNDKELTELRLEALKSAMLKKHMARKKRKLGSDSEEVDKENSKADINVEQSDKGTQDAKKSDEAVAESANVTVEEDLDIMRAMLLASMSTKIAKITDNLPKTLQNNQPNKQQQQIVNKNVYKLQKSAPKHVIRSTYFNNNKHTVNNKTNTLQPKIPTVAPLIIKVNSDSDSDMDLESPQEEEDKITKTVSEFLKGERAKVEAQVESKEPKPPPKTEEFDKSVVKLLPPYRQVEYQKLKQLLNAKKKPRTRKLSNKQETSLVKKPVKNRFNTSIKEVAKLKNNPVRKAVGDSFQKTINDLQIQKDGRYCSCLQDCVLRHSSNKIRLEIILVDEVSALRSIVINVFSIMEDSKMLFVSSCQQILNFQDSIFEQVKSLETKQLKNLEFVGLFFRIIFASQ